MAKNKESFSKLKPAKYYLVFTALTAALILSILFFYHRVYRHDLFHLKQQVFFSLNLVSIKVSQEISGDILKITAALSEAVKPPFSNQVTPKPSQQYLKTLLDRLERYHIGSIELLNSDGKTITSVAVPGWENPPVDRQQHLRIIQQEKLAKPTYKIISGSSKKGEKFLLILVPAFSAAGEFQGAIGAFLAMDQFANGYNSSNFQDIYFWLFERNQDIVFYPNLAKPSIAAPGGGLNSSMVQFLNKLNRGEESQGEYQDPSGRNTLAVATAINAVSKDLLLVFVVPEEQVEDLIRHFHSDHLSVTLCIVFLISGGSLLAFRFIIRCNGALHQEIVERKEAEKQKEHLICELEHALSEIEVLSGFLPICAWCKKIRDDKGYWNQLEEYISEHPKAQFSHGICPDCCQELYPGMPPKDDQPKNQ